jgi:uncharacterized membrane protein YccC
MATELQRQRLRLDLGFVADDVLSLSDQAADDIYVEAGERYTDESSIDISARVISLRRLLMQAANEVDHTQNKSSERSSQRYAHLSKELERWQGLLDLSATVAEGGSVRSGKPMVLPPRVKEYPEGFRW